MNWVALAYFLGIGALAGWLAGFIMRGGGFGLLMNILLGVAGAYVGAFVFRFLGIATHGLVGMLITATAGAAILLFLAGLLRK